MPRYQGVLSRTTADQATIEEALRYTRVVFKNKEAKAVERKAFRLGDNTEPMTVLAEPPGERVLLTTRVLQDSSDLEWYSVLEEQSGLRVFRFSHKLFVKALQARRWLVSQGMPGPPLAKIVVGMNSGNAGLFEDIHNALVDLHSLGDAVFGLDMIMWYLSGDFFWWYDLLTSVASPLQFFMPMPADEAIRARADVGRLLGRRLSEDEDVPFELLRRELSDRWQESHTTWLSRWASRSGGDLLVMRSPGVAGFLLRMFPAVAANAVFEVLLPDVESGIFTRIPNKEGRKYVSQVLRARNHIASLWTEF